MFLLGSKAVRCNQETEAQSTRVANWLYFRWREKRNTVSRRRVINFTLCHHYLVFQMGDRLKELREKSLKRKQLLAQAVSMNFSICYGWSIGPGYLALIMLIRRLLSVLGYMLSGLQECKTRCLAATEWGYF